MLLRFEEETGSEPAQSAVSKGLQPSGQPERLLGKEFVER
jgi:hypothetical protein